MRLGFLRIQGGGLPVYIDEIRIGPPSPEYIHSHKTVQPQGLVSQGQTLTYTIVIANLGPSTASQAQVTDLLPADVIFDSYPASQGSYEPTTGLWTVGSLGAGQDATLTLFVTVNPDASGTLENTAQGVSEDHDPYPENNTATVQTGVQAGVHGD